jgi:GNAT superfamily N-acetyltransferase
VEVRQLYRADLGVLAELRRQALTRHPLAFSATVEDDHLLGLVDRGESPVESTDSVIFGAFEAGTLVGMAGLVRAAGQKHRHKAMVWGMYVATGSRGSGAGRALIEAVIARARDWPGLTHLHLCVTEAAGEARRLYESLGFVEWGREPRSLRWDERFVDESHMALELTRAGPPSS